MEKVDELADGFVEPDVEEARSTKGMRGPTTPTIQEREDHERSHLPFQNWCAHCIRGKSKSSGHSSAAPDLERSKSIVSLDYAFLGVKKGKDKAESEKLEDEGSRRGSHTPVDHVRFRV